MAPVFPVPLKELIENELIIGKTIYGGRRISDIGIKPEWLREHVTVLGATGTGKTNLVKKLMLELSLKTNVPWWVFDIKGSEYADLARWDSNILILSPGEDPSFVIDMLDTEMDSSEVDAHATFTILRELINERGLSSELSPAMEKLLRESVMELAKSRRKTKSVQALNKIISKLAGTDRFGNMTRDALLNRLEILSREPLGSILSGGSKALKISTLLNKRVVFDMRHVARVGGMDAVRILYNLVAKRIFDSAMKRGISSGLHHVVVLEEASNLVPESYTRHSNILANTATKITFRLPYDSSIGARYMALNAEQEEYLKSLKCGRALIHVPNSDTFEIATKLFLPMSETTKQDAKDAVIQGCEKIEFDKIVEPCCSLPCI
jgi:DNA helicase HerA-like ATPase